jgi:CheY-like chemotaxis protein
LRGNSGVSFLDQSSGLSMSVGRRSGHPSVQLGLRYGSPFDPEATRPYDAFELNLEVSPGAGGGVRTVEITGLLARGGLGETVRSQALLGLFQHYEYQHLPGLELGGHSVSGALLYRHTLGERNNLELGAELEGLLLGAISSDQGFEWRRDYDLGPGAGARVNAALARDGREWLRMEGRMLWLHSVHGSGGDHLATIVKVAGAIPLAGPLAVGGDLALSTRHSTYPDFSSTTRRIPEARAYLSWSPWEIANPELPDDVWQMQHNVLVVDDEAMARRLMERALSEAGYRVMLANNGEQALQLLRTTRRHISLIVTDLVMPGMGGHAFAVEVARFPSPPPLLYISAYGRPQGEIAKRFLQKPFTPAQLVSAVQSLISPPQEVGS